jgi:hypothetical protein
MKKIGLICLAVVLTLGIAGVGFGWWSETLDIGQNPINTGNVDAIFRQAISNDDGSVGPRFCINGYWMESPYVDNGDDGNDPTACQTMGGAVNRIGQNLATTTVTGAHPDGYQNVFTIGTTSAYHNLTVTITGAYPSYYATIFFNILNAGTVPCKVQSVKLVGVSKSGSPTGSPNLTMVACTTYYVDADTGNVDTTLDAGDDFSIHLSDDQETLYDVMGTPFQTIDTAAGDLCIHVEEGAEENTSYDFTVEIVVVPFNG